MNNARRWPVPKSTLPGSTRLRSRALYGNPLATVFIDPIITDSGGRFELVGLPAGLIVGASVEFPDRTKVHLRAVTELTASILQDAGKMKSLPLDGFNMAGVARRVVEVEVFSANGKLPLADVDISGPGSSAVTEKSGKARLRLVVGTYTLHVEANPHLGYAPAEVPVDVAADLRPEVLRVPLTRCCRLEIEVVDADSGKPVTNVGVFRVGENPSSADVSMGDFNSVPHKLLPTDEIISDAGGDTPSFTDAAGKLVAFARPKPTTLRIDDMVSSRSPGKSDAEIAYFELVKGPNMPLDLKPGAEIKLRFELRKK
jgi:hypothetical protein